MKKIIFVIALFIMASSFTTPAVHSEVSKKGLISAKSSSRPLYWYMDHQLIGTKNGCKYYFTGLILFCDNEPAQVYGTMQIECGTRPMTYLARVSISNELDKVIDSSYELDGEGEKISEEDANFSNDSFLELARGY